MYLLFLLIILFISCCIFISQYQKPTNTQPQKAHNIIDEIRTFIKCKKYLDTCNSDVAKIQKSLNACNGTGGVVQKSMYSIFTCPNDLKKCIYKKNDLSANLNTCDYNLQLTSQGNTNTMGFSSFSTLYPGNYLISKNKKYRFTYERDGILSVKYLGKIIWQTRQKPPSGFPGTFVIQKDLNVVAYDSKGFPYWSSGTGVKDIYYGWGYDLVMEDDGGLILYDPNKKIIKLLTDIFINVVLFTGGPIYIKPEIAIPEIIKSKVTEIIIWTLHVTNEKTLDLNLNMEFPIITNGKFVGNQKHPDFYENLQKLSDAGKDLTFGLGGWVTPDGMKKEHTYGLIKTCINKYGTGPETTLYKNFATLKAAYPMVTKIDFDDENLYDTNSLIKLSIMLEKIGYKISLCVFTRIDFWRNVVMQVNTISPGTIEYLNLQCYSGGINNNPKEWFDKIGIPLLPGIAAKDDNSTIYNDPAKITERFKGWINKCPEIEGGFIWYYDDLIGGKLDTYVDAIRNAFL